MKIYTDEGIYGIGEGSLQYKDQSLESEILDFAKFLIDKDPFDIEFIWTSLYRRVTWTGGAVTMSAISAIDLALWDIKAKALDVPVYQLLGGAFRTKIKPYATGFYRIKGKGEASRLAEEALSHFENGFDHMKVKLGFGIDDDLKCMESIGHALKNKNVTLMIDTNHAYGRSEALTLGKNLQSYKLRWYEEPVVPEDIKGYAELRSKLDIPIAGGENEHTLFGFKSLFENNAIDIAQPDIGSCGGITGAKHIINLAHSFGVEVNPHVWGSAIAQAASCLLYTSPSPRD